MAECGRKALSLLEAVRSRYESLQISDDVFGESGDDSSENPFYSTSGDSSSENYTSESNGDEQRSAEMSGNQSDHPHGSVSNIQAEEEGWTDALREITVPPFKDTCAALCLHSTLYLSSTLSQQLSVSAPQQEPVSFSTSLFVSFSTAAAQAATYFGVQGMAPVHQPPVPSRHSFRLSIP
ncbi:UNVERIFIED_CONTAM: hypothetical protein FKN15_041090 [Acipenser sinensis]